MPNMPLAEALALLRHHVSSSSPTHAPTAPRSTASQTASRQSPSDSLETVILPDDPVADRESLRQLAVACDPFSPRVGLDAPEQPDGLWLDITGLGHLFHGEDSLVQTIAAWLRQRGYWAQLAVADTAGAAWALARFGFTDAQASSKPLPILQVAAGQSATALHPLPIQALRLPLTTIDALLRLGIERIDQLLELPRDGITSRLGTQLLQRLDQAFGAVDETWPACQPDERFQARCTLEYPTDRREAVEQLLQHLCLHLTEQLAARDRGALQVACWVGGPDLRPQSWELNLFRPTACPDHLWHLLKMQIESLRLSRPLSTLQLHAIATAPLPRRQQVLWQELSTDHGRELAGLIDRLSSRLGSDAVQAVRLRAHPLPEEAVTSIPYTGPRASLARQRAPGGLRSPWLPHQRPLQLFRPPLALKATGIVPEGPPVWFDFQGQRYHIARHWGPERIETAWWQGACVRRDYYRVECQAGQRFWLFRDLQQHTWFLHGCFI